MAPMGWVIEGGIAISVVVLLFLAVRRKRKDCRKWLEPVLAEHGLKYVSAEYPGLFKTGPFPKFEIRIAHISVRIFGISGQYSLYRRVVFQDENGKLYELWACLEFEAFRLRRIRWRDEGTGRLPKSASALLNDDHAGVTPSGAYWNRGRVLGTVAVISAIIFLILSACFFVHSINVKRTAVAAEGDVVALRTGEGDDGGTLYYPVIRFADRGGQEHMLYSRMGSRPAAFAVGERVTVLYDPTNPDHASIDSFFGLWAVPAILGIIGVFNLFMGFFFLILAPVFIPRIFGTVSKRL